MFNRTGPRCAQALGALLISSYFSLVGAQTSPLASFETDHAYDSGEVANTGTDWAVVASEAVVVPGATWLQLEFAEITLSGDIFAGTASTLRITSHLDGAVQELNAIHCRQWQNKSAYFNGEAVQVELLAAPGTGRNRLRLVSLTAGLPSTQESQCGPVDDRILSNDPRSARLLPIGCTGWTIDDCSGCFLTAGHCQGGTSTAQFNVPLSNSNGSINHPGPEDQYAVDPSSVQSFNGGIGNDWGYFGCFPNSQTGLTPAQANGSVYTVVMAPPFNPNIDIRITGYGVDGTPSSHNQVQQTHVGPLFSISGPAIRYQTDTEGGNSGSPVIWEQTGEAIGIHCHGGCSSTNGNSGTTLAQSGLANALANPLGLCGTGGMDLASTLPSSLVPGVGDTFEVDVIGGGGVLPGTALLHVRYDGGAFIDIPMAEGTPGLYQATLPPPVCDASVEYYVSVDTASCGLLSLPADAPAELYSTPVGTQVLAFADDFETDQGWVSGEPGDTAATGQWVRVDPIGTAAQPEDDHTAAAGVNCWVTGQGGQDVDSGRVTLVSPTMDLSGVNAPIISYWRWFSNSTGGSSTGDEMRIQISDDDGASYVTADLLNSPQSGGWVYNQFNVADYVTPNSTVKVRFRCTDIFFDTPVEGALDDFGVFALACDLVMSDCNGNGILDSDDIASGRSSDVDTNGVPDECVDPGSSVCFGDGSGTACPCANTGGTGEGCAHSGGQGMLISGSGSTSIAADDLALTATQVPVNNTGIFYTGTTSPANTLFDGVQCAGGSVRRFAGISQNSGSAADTDFVAQAGAGYFVSGSTYTFQFWSRDVDQPSPCGTGANFSPGYSVTMTP